MQFEDSVSIQQNSKTIFIFSFRWDTNATDNTLTAICKSDKLFDLPPGGVDGTASLRCEARCSATKPVPPADYNLELDYTKSYYENDWGRAAHGERVMQGSKIFYKCKNAKDGVAHNYTGDVDSGQMEGSKVRHKTRIGDNWLQSMVTHPSLK